MGLANVIRGRLNRFLKGPEITEAIPLGVSSDIDANLSGSDNQSLFRSIGAQQIRANDFDILTHRKMQGMARKLYHLNGLAANLIDILVDFTVGEGLSLRAIGQAEEKKKPPKLSPITGVMPPGLPPPPSPVSPKQVREAEEDPALKENGKSKEGGKDRHDEVSVDPDIEEFNEMLQDFWTEGHNNLDAEHDSMITTLYFEGEQLIPVTSVNPVDGHMKLGNVVTERIESIAQNPAGIPVVALVSNPKSAGRHLRYFCLNSREEDDKFEFMGDAVQLTRTKIDTDGNENEVQFNFDGIAFYLDVCRARGGSRGKSFLGRALDYLDIHDEVLWAFSEAAKSGFAYFTHAIFKGLEDPKKLKEMMKNMGLLSPPENGEVIGTNESVEFESITPRASSTALDRLERILRTNIAGSLGIPIEWTGGSGEGGKHNVEAKNSVQFRRLRRIQKRVLRHFYMMVDFQVFLWKEAGELKEDFDAKYEIIRTSLDEKNRADFATTMRDSTVALETASGSLITRQAANKVMVTMLREEGFELTAEEAALPAETESPALQGMRTLNARGELTDDGAGKQPGGGGPGPGPGGKPGKTSIAIKTNPSPGRQRGAS